MITALPTPPLRSDGPATFADRGDAFMAALPAFATQANALEENVNAKEASAVASSASAVASGLTATSAANFKGLWTAQTGALNKPASVYHNGQFWALNTNLANVTTATPGVSASWTRIKAGPDTYAYDNRSALRSLTPSAGDQVVVDGLGYFVWESGSTEPDDDESCFATASGKWLLQAAHWDLVDSWQAPEWQALNDGNPAATFINSVSSTAPGAKIPLYVRVDGASIGDGVLITPSGASAMQGVIAATVTSVDMVTVYLISASNSVGSNFPVGVWTATVIKS